MIDPIILARAIHIAATLLAAGTVCFVVMVAEPAYGDARAIATLRRRCNIMVWSALGVAIASGAAWLAFLTADIYGAPLLEVCLHGGLEDVLSGTRFGAVWSARLAIAPLLALLILSPVLRLRLMQLCAAAALIGLLAFIGHAGATPGAYGELLLLSDLVHLIAAGIWLGGLPGLALLLASPRPKELAARAAGRFSTLGFAAVGALTVTGLINCWMLLGSPRNFIVTDYGRLLALKIGLFAAMLAIAAVNRLYLTPRLRSTKARQALMRNSLAETALGLGVVLLVGVLGTLSPASHLHFLTTDIPVDAAFVHIHTEKAMAEVTINPGRVGRANASIRVMHEDSSELATDNVRLALDPPASGAQPIERAAVHQTDGTWQVNGLTLGASGNWTVRVFVNAEHTKQIVLDAPIVIGPAP